MSMRYFSQASTDELHELFAKLCSTAIEWSKQNDISGLSHAGSWNVYSRLEGAVFDYHRENDLLN